MSQEVINPYLQYANLNVGEPPVQEQPWTGGLAHILNAGIKTAANNKVARLAKRIKAPLQIPQQMIATTSNTSYLTNQLLEKQKQKVLARANQNLTSNADYNLAKMRQAQDVASQYTDKQASITAQGYDQDAQAANKATNYNLQQNIKAANINDERLAAVNELYNKADQKRIISNASAITDSIRDYVADRGENIKVQKEYNLMKYRAQLEGNVTDQELAMSEAFRRDSDINNWDQLEAFAAEMASTQALSETNPDLTKSETQLWNANINNPDRWSNPEIKRIVIKLLNGQSAVASKYRALHEQYVEQLRQQYYDAQRALRRRYISYNSSIPGKVTNDAYYKEGGKIKELKALLQYKNNVERVQQQESKNVAETSKAYHNRSSKNLNEALKTLSREQELLLKTIFS